MISSSLQPWPSERRALGETIYELVGQEGLDAALLAAYRHTDATMTKLPPEVAELEHAKFRHIATGDISSAYFQGQRRITEIIAESQDLTDYVASVYADWVAGLTNALLDNWSKTRGKRGDRVECVELVTSLMRSVFIDIAVVADFFTEAAHQRSEAEKRAAMDEIASQFEARVRNVSRRRDQFLERAADCFGDDLHRGRRHGRAGHNRRCQCAADLGNGGAGQISTTIREVSASAETTSASSQEVLASAEELANSAEQLRQQVDEFLASVMTTA